MRDWFTTRDGSYRFAREDDGAVTMDVVRRDYSVTFAAEEWDAISAHLRLAAVESAPPSDVPPLAPIVEAPSTPTEAPTRKKKSNKK